MKTITTATGNYGIKEIESLPYEIACHFCNEGLAEKTIINDHECFFMNFEGYFGYSILVYRNKHIIKHAGDYQLHHRSMAIEELKAYYIEKMSNKLYSDEQFFSPCADYFDYHRKMDFSINHWADQFGIVSAWYIGEPSEEQKQAKETMCFDHHAMCYVPEMSIVEQHGKMMAFLHSELDRLQNDSKAFRSMVQYELRNHEACYSHDYTEALAALGLKFSDLSPEKQQIVNDLMWAENMRTDI